MTRFASPTAAPASSAMGDRWPRKRIHDPCSQNVDVVLQGTEKPPIDDWLAPPGVVRDIAAEVSGFAAALALARGSDLIATVPERHTRALRTDMFWFPLPVPAPGFTVSLLWHPRMDGDAAHRWLRGCVREVCAIR